MKTRVGHSSMAIVKWYSFGWSQKSCQEEQLRNGLWTDEWMMIGKKLLSSNKILVKENLMVIGSGADDRVSLQKSSDHAFVRKIFYLLSSLFLSPSGTWDSNRWGKENQRAESDESTKKWDVHSFISSKPARRWPPTIVIWSLRRQEQYTLIFSIELPHRQKWKGERNDRSLKRVVKRRAPVPVHVFHWVLPSFHSKQEHKWCTPLQLFCCYSFRSTNQ